MGNDEPSAGPDVVEVEAGKAAVVWARLTFAEIPIHQRSAIERVYAALARAGSLAGGPRLTFSRAPEGDTIDIAPGRMFAATGTALDDVTVEVIPAGRAAHLSFVGPYAGLAKAWRELSAWIVNEGLQPRGPCWEVYTDPAAPVTDLFTLLA